MEELFIKASRKKLRFEGTGKGIATVEDLWVLPLEKLDEMAGTLDDIIAKAGKKSRLETKTNESTEAEHKLGIIEFIIKTRQAESVKAKARQAKAQERRNLEDLLANKEQAALQNLTVEQIKAKLDALEGED